MKAVKELYGKKTWKKKDSRPRYFLYFDFISGFNNHSLIQTKSLRLPDKVLKCVSRFWADMSIIRCFQLYLLSPLFGVFIVILTSPLLRVFIRGSLLKETATTSGKVNQHTA